MQSSLPDDKRYWWQLLNRYHWFVFSVAALGWLFDTMDQQIFVLSRRAAMTELLDVKGKEDAAAIVKEYSGYATSIFIMGWAMGGLIFGILGDRYGRARMMLVTILIYSVFTGVSSLSVGFWDFALWRFLTGLGVGGEFAVGVALIAEVMPNRARPHVLGFLQALSTVGNVTAAFILLAVGKSESELFGSSWSGWRLMFLVGTLPALLAIVIRLKLREPEQWTALSADEQMRKRMGSIKDLFGHPTWRKHALLGLGLAVSGVIALWGVAFFVFGFVAELFEPRVGHSRALDLVFNASLMFNVGGFFGMFAFSQVTAKLGRKPTFAFFFVLSAAAIAGTFLWLNKPWHIYVLVPWLGFSVLALFGGYAIYLPELFPTRLRSTGVSFCYNVGRFVAAIGPFTFGILASSMFRELPGETQTRYSGVSMCAFLLIGLAVLPFIPETKGKPLPEEEITGEIKDGGDST